MDSAALLVGTDIDKSLSLLDEAAVLSYNLKDYKTLLESKKLKALYSVVYTIEAESTRAIKKLDLSDLPSGIYAVFMKEGEENYYQKLIIL